MSSKLSGNELSESQAHEIKVNSQGEGSYDKQKDQIIPNKVSYWNMCHVATVLGACAISLAPQILISRHNSIYYPEHRHELILLIATVCSTGTVAKMTECFYLTQEMLIVTIRVTLKMFLSFFLPALTFFFSTWFYWTTIMEYLHPMPLTGLAIFFPTWFIVICSLWLMIMFPREIRIRTDFRRKIRRYVTYDIWYFIMNVQKDLLSFAFKAIPRRFQFLFAVIIPTAKKFNKWILFNIMSEVIGKDDDTTNVLLGVRLNIHYALFVAIRMDGAETNTIISILIVDFLHQLWMTIQIIRLNQKVSAEENINLEEVVDGTEKENKDVRKKKEKVNEGSKEMKARKEIVQSARKEAITKLILAEIVEGTVPLAYMIGFAMAYFGPNAYLTGNVLSDVWAYKQVEDITRLFQIQLLLFGVDSLCVLLNHIILFKFGNVNLIRELCKIYDDYWLLIVLILPTTLVSFFARNDVNCAMDMTLSFDWITREGRLQFIQNSSQLTDYEKNVLLSNRSSMF